MGGGPPTGTDTRGHTEFQIIFCTSAGNSCVATQKASRSALVGQSLRPLQRKLCAIRPSLRGVGGGDCTAFLPGVSRGM